MSRSGIVNVRMVITEEKILSNIEKVQKLINPNSKKQIVQLDDDTYFKDMIESIKAYLIEYPKKNNFPASVYKAAYGLVEFATNQFEENTKKIEELIRQREQNISLAGDLKELVDEVEAQEEGWEDDVAKAEGKFTEDVIENLNIVGNCEDDTSEEYENAMKILNARVNNLETNLHIEIDMERIEDRSKALSYIGIEVADALKSIPTPVEEIQENNVGVEEQIQTQEQSRDQLQVIDEQQYVQDTTFEVKPSLWQRIKNSKFCRAIRYVTKIRLRLDVPQGLPEGQGQEQNN